MYGYWTHCFYSCEAESYDTYVRLKNARPPVGCFDKHYNKLIIDPQTSDNVEEVNYKSIYSLPANMPYDKDMCSIVRGLDEVWTLWPHPPYANMFYNFSYFTMTLNQMRPGYEKTLAPTDSRHRADLRQLELGNLGTRINYWSKAAYILVNFLSCIDGASDEKTHLEEKQREARKKHNNDEYKGTWFHIGKHEFIDENIWLFNNKYWNRDYKNCPYLF